MKKRALTRHQHIHTNVEPYECKWCDKAFAEKIQLTNHQRIHTGEQPYKCSRCDKAYNHRKNLKLHMVKHWEKSLSSVDPAPV